ncbi:hypothetical protein CASFOL_004020 [Castilleja foliolosa]|uniref:Late nodulin domain-containing protein n=1 Tax=Castilleja foliolosa TaxID=1961234 RepID=A0ABD3EMD5_9LAMI
MASQKLIFFLFAFFLVAQVVTITLGYEIIPCKTTQDCRHLLTCIDILPKCVNGECICPVYPSAITIN